MIFNIDARNKRYIGHTNSLSSCQLELLERVFRVHCLVPTLFTIPSWILYSLSNAIAALIQKAFVLYPNLTSKLDA